MGRDAYWDCTTTTTDWYQYDPYNNTYYYLGSNSSTTCIPTGGSSGISSGINIASLWNNTNGTGGGTYNSGGALSGETVDGFHPLCPNTFVFQSLGPNGNVAGLRNVNIGYFDGNGVPIIIPTPYMNFSVYPQTTAIDVTNVFNQTRDSVQNRIDTGFLDRFAGNQSQIQSALRAEFFRLFNIRVSTNPNFGGSSQVLDHYDWRTFVAYQLTKVFPDCQ